MIINDELKARLIKEIKLKLAEDTRDFETEIHLSDLTRCITKSFWQRLIATTQEGVQAHADSIDDRSALFMYIGVMGEAVLDELAPERESRQFQGITARADWEIGEEEFLELKTTRIYVRQENKVKTWPSKGFPVEWIRRMAGYCWIYETQEWHLGMVLVVGGDIMTYTFKFGAEELIKYWADFLKPRHEVLRNAIVSKLPPKAYRYNDDWECTVCPFKMFCDFQAEDTMNEERLGIKPANMDYLERADVGMSPIAHVVP